MNRMHLSAHIRSCVLTKSQRRVLLYLLRLQSEHKGAPLFPSIYKTAVRLEMSDSTVRTAFAVLRHFGVLKTIAAQAGGATPCVYIFSDKAILSVPIKGSEIAGVKPSAAKSLGLGAAKSLGITRASKPGRAKAPKLRLLDGRAA